MRIAVIADIHSNVFALDAVLGDLDRRGADHLVHLGDAFNGPIDPAGVADRLRQRSMDHVSGNGERMTISDQPTERTRSADYARERLDPDILCWIGSWPKLISRAEYCAFHGTPQSDVSYLVEDVTQGAVRLRARSEITADLAGVIAPLALCAHSHLPQRVRVHETLLVVNPGSVGLPAYKDLSPVPHRMEVGSPDARYAIVEIAGPRIAVVHLSVPYDHREAAAIAASAGFEAWSRTLLTGYAE